MWGFPLAAAGVSGVFAAIMLRRFFDRGRPHELAWGVALLMFAVASFAAAMGILGGWSDFKFRTYYLFGAIINVPFLGLGTLYLLVPRKIAHAVATVVVATSIYAAGAVFTAQLNNAALNVAGSIPAGSEVMPEAVRTLSRYFSFAGFFVVVGGALASAWRLSRAPGEAARRLASGNILIAAGTFVVAVGSGFARYAAGSIFAIGLLAGVTLMFAGFLRTLSRLPGNPTPNPEGGSG
jgi:hypothetical protein